MNTLTFQHSRLNHNNKQRRFNPCNDNFYLNLNNLITDFARGNGYPIGAFFPILTPEPALRVRGGGGYLTEFFDNLPALLKFYREKDLTAVLDALPDGLGSDPSWAIAILRFLGGLEND